MRITTEAGVSVFHWDGNCVEFVNFCLEVFPEKPSYKYLGTVDVYYKWLNKRTSLEDKIDKTKAILKRKNVSYNKEVHDKTKINIFYHLKDLF